MSDDTSLQEINLSLRSLIAAFQSLEDMLRAGTNGAQDRREAFLQILGGLANRIDRAVEPLERHTAGEERLARCETMLEILMARQLRDREREAMLHDAVESLISRLEEPLGN
ncbi:hypothetical protein GI374_17645 [Paracoccus sp. S-4012]|uniref:hypothetical protein n=1 Tax=Paracoccus sp. S-4012 TaxID=2665648 RepID=UPI0012AFEC1F|nr:hypothetical protein [Paracoccus sp. S-4012]MRX52189.1 hypothetical protein [Paracoccus sp. S-4012]